MMPKVLIVGARCIKCGIVFNGIGTNRKTASLFPTIRSFEWVRKASSNPPNHKKFCDGQIQFELEGP